MKKIFIIALSVGVAAFCVTVVHAATTFQGPPPPCTSPEQPGCNTDGVIWNRTDPVGAGPQDGGFNVSKMGILGGGLRVDSGGANIKGGAYITGGATITEGDTTVLNANARITNGDLYFLTSGKAIRVDSAGDSYLNIGNWGPLPSRPINVSILGNLIMEPQGTWNDPRIVSPKICLPDGAPGNCITSWPAGGGGGDITGVTAGYGLQGGGDTGDVSLGVADLYLMNSGDTGNGSYLFNGDASGYGTHFFVQNNSISGGIGAGFLGMMMGITARSLETLPGQISYGVKGVTESDSGVGVVGDGAGLANNKLGTGVLGRGSTGVFGRTANSNQSGIGGSFLANRFGTAITAEGQYGIQVTSTDFGFGGLTGPAIIANSVANQTTILANKDIVTKSGRFCFDTDCISSWPVGGGTPAGADTQVQFNNNGSFGGDSTFRWLNSSRSMFLGNSPGAGGIINIDATGNAFINRGLYITNADGKDAIDISSSYRGLLIDSSFKGIMIYSDDIGIDARTSGGANNQAGYFQNQLTNTQVILASGDPLQLNKIGGGVMITAQAEEALWYDGNQFRWGAGGTSNYFEKPVNIGTSASLLFGSTARQMLNLYSTTYAIGVQSNTQYYRSNGNFAWFRGGIHSNTTYDPGDGGTNLMYLSSSGELHLKGGTAGYYFVDRTNSARDWTWYANGGFSYLWTTTQGNRLRVDTNGNLAIRGVLNQNTDVSDIRLKKDIYPMRQALEKVTKLNGYNFRWKNPKDHQDYYGYTGGFIAQEIEEVFPYWVHDIEPMGDGDKQSVGGGTAKVLNIPYELDALLVESVKELKTENDILKARIDELEGRLQVMEARLSY